MKRYYINLKIGDSLHTILVVGYTKDGGFFMSNVKHDGGNHIIFAHYIPLSKWFKVGVHWTKRKKRPFITSNIPKLIHHADGRSQVSGDGITSGFYKFFKRGKGVYTKSYDLITVNNDGGPTMSSTVWGLEHFPYMKKDNSIVFDKEVIFEDFISKQGGFPVSYVIEGYYIRGDIKPDFLFSDDIVLLNHPNYGMMKGKIIPHPKHSPGYLILTCMRSSINEGFCDFPYGHQISGAPSFITWRGCKNIFIQYPDSVFPAEFISKAKSLDFGKKELIKSKIDDFLYNFFFQKKK